MSAHRTPAAIAADLRDLAGQLLTMRVPVYGLADEVEALPVLTAEEVADLRERLSRGDIDDAVRALDDEGYPNFAAYLEVLSASLVAVLDRLDPPTVDPDGRSGVDYCIVHHGIRNEDDGGRCDLGVVAGIVDDDELRPCVVVPLTYDPAAARAALAERGAS